MSIVFCSDFTSYLKINKQIIFSAIKVKKKKTNKQAGQRVCTPSVSLLANVVVVRGLPDSHCISVY